MSDVGLMRPVNSYKQKLYGPIYSDELRLFASQLSYSGLEAAALLANLRASPEPFSLPTTYPAADAGPAGRDTEQRLKLRTSPPKISGPKKPKEPKVRQSCLFFLPSTTFPLPVFSSPLHLCSLVVDEVRLRRRPESFYLQLILIQLGQALSVSISRLRQTCTLQVCNDCGCTETCFWRRDKLSGRSLCNACGLFLTK